MGDRVSNEPYNYTTFEGTEDFLAFRTALPAGSQAVDGPVIDAATGERRMLSDYWAGKDLVIEFGSLT